MKKRDLGEEIGVIAYRISGGMKEINELFGEIVECDCTAQDPCEDCKKRARQINKLRESVRRWNKELREVGTWKEVEMWTSEIL